ncbi:hypothetical protein OMAG_002300 [Candidatus Omnitrophus magneticus]|uniref:Uncharacterized protein n=1 Tax=Candidatus Omnitrophus magneticus TaxID=1609969 RepID=A0A0F0CKJ4_9BACT|nr:hypothetical protein OMAG_002300 [Candidatus Omnitrophus magneticus]
MRQRLVRSYNLVLPRARGLTMSGTAIFSIILFPCAICYNLAIFIYKIIWRKF